MSMHSSPSLGFLLQLLSVGGAGGGGVPSPGYDEAPPPLPPPQPARSSSRLSKADRDRIKQVMDAVGQYPTIPGRNITPSDDPNPFLYHGEESLFTDGQAFVPGLLARRRWDIE